MQDQTKFVDLQGNYVSEDTQYIAEEELNDGTVRIYRDTPEDVAKLIAALREQKVEDQELLSEDFWLARAECRNMAARKCSQGSCSSGSCQLVTSGGFNFCMCK